MLSSSRHHQQHTCILLAPQHGWSQHGCLLPAAAPAPQPFAAATTPPDNDGAAMLLLHHHAEQQEQQEQLMSLHYSTLLLQQLDAVGWQRVARVSADLCTVVLALHDAAGRCHEAHVQLQPAAFPGTAPAVAVQLPAPFKPRWRPGGDSLASLVLQLEQALAAYQPLWQQLEDLDQHTQVLDPATVLRRPYAHCSRCVALGNGASCQLQLSPASPGALPTAVFHGPSSVVAGLQRAWYGAAHALWQEEASVRENLEAVLQLRLPAPKRGARSKGCAAVAAAAGARVVPDGLVVVGGAPGAGAAAAASSAHASSSDDDDDDEEDEEDAVPPGACAICYCLHLPAADPGSGPDELGAAPAVTCGAARCGRAFHAACLAEWLGALPTSRRVYDTVFGACPFCQEPIGVSTRSAAVV